MSTELKPSSVDKPIPVTYDFGNLAVFDSNPLSDLSDDSIVQETRNNVQLLVNQILRLPSKRTTDSVSTNAAQDSTTVLFALPEPTTLLPRAKPVPKTRPPTKWEQFASKKGIQKKGKDGKLVYDEASEEWVPKWGYKGKNKAINEQWLVEVDEKKEADSGLIDPRSLNRMERKKLVKKNQLQKERNLKKR